MRAVLDTNVHVSALLAPSGPPAQLVDRWLVGHFELVVSPALLGELERVLCSAKLQRRLRDDVAIEYLDLVQNDGMLVDDPSHRPRRTEDPDDDHLIALAASAGALLVSGDRHLLALSTSLPIRSPRAFLDVVDG